MYSIGNVFRREPQAITSAVIGILNVFVIAGVITVSKDLALAINTALLLGLGLFYVRPLTVSKKSMDDLSATTVRKRKR